MYRPDFNDDYTTRDSIYPIDGIYKLPDYIPTITNFIGFVQGGLASLVDSLFFGGFDDDRKDPRKRPPHRHPRK